MTMLPMEHEKTITLFAERALLEAYQNGKKDYYKKVMANADEIFATFAR